jgi:hypothetical protein
MGLHISVREVFMTNEKTENQPITIYPFDRAIVEAVQKRNGQTFSAAVRFILREWARSSGLQDTLTETIAPTPQRVITPRASARSRARKEKIEAIPGLKRGLKTQ